MESSLTDTIINQVIGAIIGTIVSFITSWYFYKKADFPSRVTSDMTENILRFLIQDRIGENFELHEKVSESLLPKDKDVPHIIHFWLSKKTVLQGESISILFRVEDSGLNFPATNEGVEVTDSHNNVTFPVTRQGHGYFSCTVSFPDVPTVEQHTVLFKLTDRRGKSHKQFLNLNSMPRLS